MNRGADDCLGDQLAAQAAARPEHRWLRFRDGPDLTLDETHRAAAALAHGLTRLGIVGGDRIVVLAPNRVETILTWFAGSLLGAVFVPVNTAYRGVQLRDVLANAEPRVVCVTTELCPAVSEAVAVLHDRPVIVVFGAAVEPDQHAFDDLSIPDGDPTFPVVSATDLQSIVYTSGTTGPSKGVMISHRQASTFARVVGSAAELDVDDVCYTCLPLFHINAQLSVLGALLTGSRVVISERFSASTFWSEIDAAQATLVSLFGAMSPIVLAAPGVDQHESRSLRACWVFPASPEVTEELERRLGVSVLTAYASTEANFVAISGIGNRRPPGAAGHVHEWFDVRIVDDADHDVAPGEVGEIVVRPLRPGIMMDGYFRMPEATVRAWRNLWFHTGDLGKLGADRVLYFTDRKADAIRRRGENISAYEVERVLTAHPAVLEAAVIGVPFELGEQDVMAVVIARDGCTLDPAELAAWCQPRIAQFMVPRYIDIVDDLPRTPNGKVQKALLRERGVTTSTWGLRPQSVDRESGSFTRRST